MATITTHNTPDFADAIRALVDSPPSRQRTRKLRCLRIRLLRWQHDQVQEHGFVPRAAVTLGHLIDRALTDPPDVTTASV